MNVILTVRATARGVITDVVQSGYVSEACPVGLNKRVHGGSCSCAENLFQQADRRDRGLHQLRGTQPVWPFDTGRQKWRCIIILIREKLHLREMRLGPYNLTGVLTPSLGTEGDRRGKREGEGKKRGGRK